MKTTPPPRNPSIQRLPVLLPRFPFPSLPFTSLALLPVLLVRAQVPGLDEVTLGGVDLALVLDVLDADAEPVLGEDDVLLAHALGDVPLHLGDAEVDLVADPGEAGEDEDGEEEGEELSLFFLTPGGEGGWKLVKGFP